MLMTRGGSVVLIQARQTGLPLTEGLMHSGWWEGALECIPTAPGLKYIMVADSHASSMLDLALQRWARVSRTV